MTSLPPSPRIQAIHDVGVKIDDALERAHLDTARREGAHEAYTNIVSSFSTLMSDIDVETARGGDLEIAKLWLNKLLVICKNMVDYSSTQLHAARGAEAQTKLIIETVKRMYDTEVAISARIRADQFVQPTITSSALVPEASAEPIQPAIVSTALVPEVPVEPMQPVVTPAPAIDDPPSRRPIPAATLKEQRRNALVTIKP